MDNFDVIIIGAGPGGYVSAIRAAQAGLKTCIIERDALGGICLNWGCIPTKALLRSADILRTMQHANDYGININGAIKPDLTAMIQRSRQVSSQLSKGVAYLLKKNKVTIMKGTAMLQGQDDGRHNVMVTKGDASKPSMISAANVIIATGAHAKEIPGFEYDGVMVWSYKEALNPPKKPNSMVILGSGAIGVEFASFYHAIGVDVTIVEMQPTIVPNEDADIASFMQQSFTKQGITIYTHSMAKSLTKHDDSVTLHIEHDGKAHDIKADILLSAIGISPNSANLGLEYYPDITLDKGHIVTDEWAKTPYEGLYAIGDITQGPWLAHKAEHEGVIAIERIAGIYHGGPLQKNMIPACTYCHPQIASLGLSEAAAIAQGYNIKIGKMPYIGNGKAIALGETEGFIKVIFDKHNGELLGAHMVGAEVTELIQGYAIGKTLETTEQDLQHTIFPHPTLSEMMHEAALDADDKAIHI